MRINPRHKSLTALAIGVAVVSAATASTATAATAGGTLYVLQGVAGATMTLTLDGRQIAASAAAKRVIGPLSVTPGRHVVRAVPSGGGPAVEATVAVGSGRSVDAVVHRQVDPSAAPVITTYQNDLSKVTPGSGRISVAHTAAVGPADIRVKGKVLFENVANGEHLTLTVPAGTYPVDIVPTGATSPVVLGPVDLSVQKNALTRVFAIGVAATGSMDAIVQVLPLQPRGSGAQPGRVDAGGGGQAAALSSGAPSAGGVATPTQLWAGLTLAAGSLLFAAAGLWASRRPARSAVTNRRSSR